MYNIKLFFISMIFIVVYGCKFDRSNSDNIINIRLKKDPERINPLVFPNPTAREVYQYLHLPLADFDPVSYELTPIMIKSLPKAMIIDTGIYAGGVSFEFEIVDDAVWDNGDPITGEDYIFTMKAVNLPLSNAARAREFTQHIADIKIDQNNNKKVKVIYKEDYILALETAVNIEVYPRYFYDSLNLLSKYDFKILNDSNQENIKEDSTLTKFAEAFNGNEFSRNKISGAGPYKFVSWTADQNVVLEKKANYWGQNSSLPSLAQGPDKMIFHIIPDELTAVTQLKSGGIDVINEISADNYDALESDLVFKDKFNFFHPALIKQYYLLLNNKDPRLNDQKIRRSLAHLMDIDNVIKNLENNRGVRTIGPVHPLKKTYHQNLTPIVYDIEKAKNLIAEAGWKDTNKNGIVDKKINGENIELELEILISGQELGKKIAILLQENAAKVGIKINITEKDFKSIRTENIKTRKYQIVPTVMSQDIQLWDEMGKWSSENDTPDGANESSYINVKVDSLIDQILSTKDIKNRILLYQNIQEEIYNDQPVVFMYAPEEKIVVSKKWTCTSTAKRPGYMANTFKYNSVGAFSDN